MLADFRSYTLVFCNGSKLKKNRLKSLVGGQSPAAVACADGGARNAIALGFRPDYIVGDLDSFTIPKRGLSHTEIVRIESQDNTDLEKTLDFMTARGHDKFLIACYSGGRMDHTLSNLQIAYELSRKHRCMLVDDLYVVVPVTAEFSQRVGAGTQVSILTMEDDTIITTRGMEYELTAERLRKGGRGISNRTRGESLTISVQSGGAMVFLRI